MKKIISALLFSSLFALSAAPAAANIWTARETGNYYELIYPVFDGDDPEIKEAINADISTRASRTADAGRRRYTTSFRYELMMENDRYLSFLFFPGGYEEGAMHGMYAGVGVVYDKTTGARLPLSHFADVTVSDLVRLQRSGHFYRYNGTPIPVENIQGRPQKVPEDYFINAQGQIFVIFSPYILACFADGVTAIDVTSLGKPGVL